MRVFAKTGHFKAVLEGRLILKIGLYASIYGSLFDVPVKYMNFLY